MQREARADFGSVEKRYMTLRRQLDELEYRQPLVIDALPLVERLVSDLLHTTDSLRHYKKLSQQYLQFRVRFQAITEDKMCSRWHKMCVGTCKDMFFLLGHASLVHEPQSCFKATSFLQDVIN